MKHIPLTSSSSITTRPSSNQLRWLVIVFTMMFALGVQAQESDQVAAQNHDKKVRERLDSALTTRYYKTSYDTNYVIRPEGKLTLKVRMNQTGNDFHAKGTVNGIYSKADLKTSHKTTFSIAGIYRGIGIGMAINPYKWSGVYKDYEFNLNYYSSSLSLDFSYQRS